MWRVCMSVYICAKNSYYTDFVISVSSPRVVVWSVVYKRTENIRYASDFSKNSECKYKQTKNTQAQQNWQSFIKMTQNWTASSETTWNNLSRKHIHIWNPSFSSSRQTHEEIFLFMSCSNFKLSCNLNIFPCLGSFLKASMNVKSNNTFSVSVQNPLWLVQTMNKKKTTLPSCTFPHIRNHSVKQESAPLKYWNTQVELPLMIQF